MAHVGARAWIGTVVAILLGGAASVAQTPESPNAGWRPPAESERCPSKWGAGDQRGSGNHMSATSVMRAAQLIRTGQTFELGQVLSADMPLIGNRRWDVVYRYSGRPPQPGQRQGLTEQVTSELGQVGTQMDGFAHQAIGGSLYNCFKLQDIAGSGGMTALGIEKAGTLITRGVLLDIAKLKGVDALGEAYVITPEDLQQALARLKLTLQPGDAVLINTGWGTLWIEDNVRYLRSSPGLGVAAAEWLLKQDPMLIAADNCCIEVRPVGVGPLIHTLFVAVHGVHLIENLKLDEISAAGAGEFAFVVQPLKMQGATGSPVAPTAIR
ncbi:MAG: hypothetical protein A3H29_01070 [Acidobacteria bacterium RIFCSPLOWO2_02_FULL_67_21]|nr:MAG: hypothetical protein A3H29_01070 [Acidobacteria bacterium RIFCSPLOWO2_02_FULL_67_21]